MGAEQQSAFENLRAMMTEPHVLTIPYNFGHFVLDTDASDYAVGGELSQIRNGIEITLRYGRQCSAIVRAAQIVYGAKRVVDCYQVYSPVSSLLARAGVHSQNRPL